MWQFSNLHSWELQFFFAISAIFVCFVCRFSNVNDADLVCAKFTVKRVCFNLCNLCTITYHRHVKCILIWCKMLWFVEVVPLHVNLVHFVIGVLFIFQLIYEYSGYNISTHSLICYMVCIWRIIRAKYCKPTNISDIKKF